MQKIFLTFIGFLCFNFFAQNKGEYYDYKTAFQHPDSIRIISIQCAFDNLRPDTTLTDDKVTEANELFQLYEDTTEGFKNRDFDKVVSTSKTLLEINPKNNAALNNWGYALLLQKRYAEAIEKFNSALEINRYFDYPLNNRGYCKLQLGDLDNALPDLHSSYHMNPTNSFSLRNLGAYYLQKNELDKALNYFERSLESDPKTEMIYFYFSHTYSRLGNLDKAKEYYDKYRASNEYNESMLDDKPYIG